MKTFYRTRLKQGVLLALALLLFAPVIPARADEGMWLLTLMRQQNYQKMKDLGLKLEATDIYNPNGNSIKDAIIIFGRGCTGSVVSDKGLVFTNHHCGYDEIREHSSVEHNYLRDGFCAMSMQEELPNPGLTVTFTEKIEDVTNFVKSKMRPDEKPDYKALGEQWYKENIGAEMPFGTKVVLKPFYEANKFYLFVQKVYHDVRLVAAPPSCIGKYGEDTDNWAWPRHSGDFSVFRIYTAPNGEPAKYSADNVPLKPKRYLKVSTEGVKTGSFAMIMGFPGSTNHFYAPKEVEERRDIDNAILIKMRGIRQDAMREEMLKDEAVKIQYASKYAGSENYYKNSKGTNWAIDKMHLVQQKEDLANRLVQYAREHQKPEYISSLTIINQVIDRRADVRKQLKYLYEGVVRAVEMAGVPLLSEQQQARLQGTDKTAAMQEAISAYDKFFNKDYSRMMDRKVSKVMLDAYTQDVPYEQLPEALKSIQDKFGGDVDRYVDALWGETFFRSKESYKSMLERFDPKTYESDPLVQLAQSVNSKYKTLRKELAEDDATFENARKTYVKGILEMEGEENLWPDANFTLRYTFGQVKGYSPRDDVFYGPQTTVEGVVEKYDPNNPEYALLPDVLALMKKPENRDRPVDFCATTHTTGGNSGSPVMDAEGRLIGLNFDRNWEGVGGDIQYLPRYQRSIICDIRYLLFILKDYLKGDRLVDELKLEE